MFGVVKGNLFIFSRAGGIDITCGPKRVYRRLISGFSPVPFGDAIKFGASIAIGVAVARHGSCSCGCTLGR